MPSELSAFLEALIKAQNPLFSRLLLYGSGLAPESMDRWSDLDLIGECSDLKDIESRLNALWKEHGQVVARERSISDAQLLDRVVLDTGQGIIQVDFKCVPQLIEVQLPEAYQQLFGPDKLSFSEQTLDEGPTRWTHSEVEGICFRAYQAVKKFMRGDNLIGLHLLLDLVREVLVMQMVDRDEALGTNLHRFGEGERLPDGLDIREIKVEDLSELCGYMERLMAYMESYWLRKNSGHVSRQTSFSMFLPY